MSERLKLAMEKYPDCLDCQKENANGGHGYTLCSKHWHQENPPKVHTSAELAQAEARGVQRGLEMAGNVRAAIARAKDLIELGSDSFPNKSTILRYLNDARLITYSIEHQPIPQAPQVEESTDHE